MTKNFCVLGLPLPRSTSQDFTEDCFHLGEVGDNPGQLDSDYWPFMDDFRPISSDYRPFSADFRPFSAVFWPFFGRFLAVLCLGHAPCRPGAAQVQTTGLFPTLTALSVRKCEEGNPSPSDRIVIVCRVRIAGRSCHSAASDSNSAALCILQQ